MNIKTPTECPACGYDGKSHAGNSPLLQCGLFLGSQCVKCGVIWWQHALEKKDKRIAELELYEGWCETARVELEWLTVGSSDD